MSKREYVLDFIKGGLVFVMLVHHSLNYFGPEYHLLIKFVRFVTGSFVFMAGFTFSNILLNKYQNSKMLSWRLVTRGFKLIVIFVVLNLIIKLLVKGDWKNFNLDISFATKIMYDVFINGNYKIVAFEILLPIGYVLITVGILILILKKNYWFLIISFLLFIYCTFMFFRFESAYNLRYFTLGLWGVSFGLISLNHYKRIFQNFYFILLGYLLHLIPLYFIRLNYLSYTIVVIVNIVFLFSLGQRLKPEYLCTRKMCFIGQYTLFGYLIQIFFMQLIMRIFLFYDVMQYKLLLGFILSSILTYLSVEFIHILRRRLAIINKAYKFIFQ